MYHIKMGGQGPPEWSRWILAGAAYRVYVSTRTPVQFEVKGMKAQT